MVLEDVLFVNAMKMKYVSLHVVLIIKVPRFWEQTKTDLVEKSHPSFSWLDTQEEMWTVPGKEESMSRYNL